MGIDWAEQFHDAVVGRAGVGVTEVRRVAHEPDAVAAFVAYLRGLEPDPCQVRVVLETRHGRLVEALLDAGFSMCPVNPDLVARRRGPARKKDDVEDARICCLLALDPYGALKPLVPHSPVAAELRSVARDDERAGRDETRLLNRLRADLQIAFPQAVSIAGGDLGGVTVLRMPARWPSRALLARATRRQLAAFARACRHPRPDRFVEKIIAARAVSAFPVAEHITRAKADTIRPTGIQLLTLAAQRKAWQRRMAELLDGGDAAASMPGGDIYLSFPGLGVRLAARIAGEVGDQVEQFATPNALSCYAGRAPVTRRSGKSQFSVVRRLAHNRFLGQAVHQWAFSSLRWSPWAREFYDAQLARGKSHHQALRALGNRWIEVLWHCHRKRVRYDETVHAANRQRHQTSAT